MSYVDDEFCATLPKMMHVSFVETRSPSSSPERRVVPPRVLSPPLPAASPAFNVLPPRTAKHWKVARPRTLPDVCDHALPIITGLHEHEHTLWILSTHWFFYHRSQDHLPRGSSRTPSKRVRSAKYYHHYLYLPPSRSAGRIAVFWFKGPIPYIEGCQWNYRRETCHLCLRMTGAVQCEVECVLSGCN